ncbi:TonB-dependent siderophore receptor [Gaoshiqia sp. Z1-71]|uniref:TonB-dependent siderophore receptor n=1 Tax=Gaoshiqia hydrogeniformans TaxID=3290090 RepID=UPI003BF85B45
MKSLNVLIVFLFAMIAGYAQTGSVSGKANVPDEGEDALINIGLKGTNKGTITDVHGNFVIQQVKAGKYKLEASFIGYKTFETEVEVLAGKETEVPAFYLQKTDEKIGEVVVTGKQNPAYTADLASSSLRISTPLLKTAQNIQVITKEMLNDQQLVDMLESVTRNTSGAMMIEHWGSFARINMRGFKLPAFRNGMNVDLPWGPLTEDLSVVDRIEFVKGPAGFMLSAGEPVGFYNVVTKKPDAGMKNEASLTMGSFNLLRSTLDLGGKIGENDRLLYRLNVMGSTKKSHRDYEFNDRYTLAPSVTYRISDRTSLNAEYIYQYSKMSVVGAAYVFSPDGYGSLPRSYTTAEPNIDPSTIREHNVFLNLNHQLDENWSLTAQLGYLNYKLVGSSLWPDSVTTAGIYRGLGVWDALSNARMGQVFVNGDVYTGPVRHRILSGLDLSDKEYFADWFQSGPLGGENNPLSLTNPVHFVNSSLIPVFDRRMSIRRRAMNAGYPAAQFTGSSSVYLQDELGFFNDRLRLTLAGRFTSYKTSVYGAATNDRVWSPRAGISYSIDDQTAIYGLYDQSFIPQSGTDKEGNNFEPVRANDLEAGIKRSWANSRWHSSLTVYQLTKENVLTADPENINYSIQLGEARSKGLELDIQGEIVKGLSLILNYANTHVEVTKDTDASKVGMRLAGHAKHISNCWLKYQFKQSDLKGLMLSLGYQYLIDRSSWSWGAGNQSVLPDYFRLDGAIGWANEKLSVDLNVNNILDKYLYSGSAYGSYYYWQTEPGTNFRLNIGFKF